MKQYLDLLRRIKNEGVEKSDRTGTGTLSIFGHQMRFDLSKKFPAMTTKKLFMKGVIGELIWFLNGDTNIKYLQDNGIKIWNEWADEKGNLGPVYGHQWRAWPTADGRNIDQISDLISQIKTNPDSRRLIVSAWNVGEIEKMALPPCHAFFQFYVAQGKLSCLIMQRSADAFLGVPFNIASYALLTCMIAQQCDLIPGELVWTGGDCHIYANHFEQVATQLSRQPLVLPELRILKRPKDIFSYSLEDFELVNYQCHEMIKAPIAV